MSAPSGTSNNELNKASQPTGTQQTASNQKQPLPLGGEALGNWYRSTLEKYSKYPERSIYPVSTLPAVKMSVSNWSQRENRYARIRLSGTVKSFNKANGFVALEFISDGLVETYIGKDNHNFAEIEADDFINIYVNYVLESNSDWIAFGEFVEMCDILDKPNAQEWTHDGVVYKKTPLQEALRITRNEGRSGKKYNLWSRDIDYTFAAGYFLLRTGTAELALVEYYGEDLKSRNGHGGVLYNIDCTGITPKVTAIKFFEYPGR